MANHIEGPRAECPGCQEADALRASVVAAAREQLARPERGVTGEARHLATLILKHLGEPADPLAATRQLAQDLLTSYHRFARGIEDSIGPLCDLEDRAVALGLKVRGLP
jgi:hypothetical protein